MKGLFKAAVAVVFVSGVQSPSNFAGTREKLIFDDAGKRIFVKDAEPVPANFISQELKVMATCAAAPDRACVKYEVSPAPGTNLSQILPQIMNAFSLWANQATLKLRFEYHGPSSVVGIPYDCLPGTNPCEPRRDDFDNEVITGNFLISFQPPAEMFEAGSGVVSKSLKYVIPNLTTGISEIKWAGIFLSNHYQAGVDYNLQWVIASEIGNLLGLGSSANRGAIMFPVQSAQPVGTPHLSSDDLAWAESLYGIEENLNTYGSVSGEIIFGNDGSKLKGVHVELIPAESINEFSLGANRTLAHYGAFSRDDGVFKIENVVPGDYVLLSESLSSIPIHRRLWDDWIYAFGTEISFNTEFYDGAERESNNESASSFSPLLIQNAAILNVVAEQETTNVQLITQATILNPPELIAGGSSNETLPELTNVVDDRLKRLNEQTGGAIPSIGGGCSLTEYKTQSEEKSFAIFIFLSCLLIGTLLRNMNRHSKDLR